MRFIHKLSTRVLFQKIFIDWEHFIWLMSQGPTMINLSNLVLMMSCRRNQLTFYLETDPILHKKRSEMWKWFTTLEKVQFQFLFENIISRKLNVAIWLLLIKNKIIFFVNIHNCNCVIMLFCRDHLSDRFSAVDYKARKK